MYDIVNPVFRTVYYPSPGARQQATDRAGTMESLEARDYSAFDASEIAQMDYGPHDFAARYRRYWSDWCGQRLVANQTTVAGEVIYLYDIKLD